MSDFIDYYEVLQVHPKAEQQVIEKAYRALILKYHPDQGGDEDRAKRIIAAYEVLGDPAARASYNIDWALAQQTVAEAFKRVESASVAQTETDKATEWVDGARAAARVGFSGGVKSFIRHISDERLRLEEAKARAQAASSYDCSRCRHDRGGAVCRQCVGNHGQF